MPPVSVSAPGLAERRNHASRQALIERVLAEFREMPGLRLTRAQAQRLFGIRPDVCERVLSTLERKGVLACGVDRRYSTKQVSAWTAAAGG